MTRLDVSLGSQQPTAAIVESPAKTSAADGADEHDPGPCGTARDDGTGDRTGDPVEQRALTRREPREVV